MLADELRNLFGLTRHCRVPQTVARFDDELAEADMRRGKRRITFSAAIALSGLLTAWVAVPSTAQAGTLVRSAAQEAGVGAAPASCSAKPAPGHAQCFLSQEPVVTAVPAKKKKTCTVNEAGGYTPCNIQNAYNLTSAVAADGKGSVVAVVDPYDDPKAGSDLAKFRKNFGLPKCTTANGCFEKFNQTGQKSNYPAANASFAQETSLDLDMVSTSCPHCDIWLVEANSNGFSDLFDAITEAITLGAHVVSDSWGTGEFNGEVPYDPTLDAPGVAITFSSGDGAYQGGVQYPSASNYVTSVGGTELTPDSSVPRGWDESTWVNTSNSPPTQGSGSGCSAYEGKPAWQTDAGCSNRTTADVSMVAANVLGYDSYKASGWYYEFGTSVSSPLIAGIYGLADNPSSIAVPASSAYTAPSSDLHDITTGSTGTCTPSYLCTAGTGYDGPTGVGTPDGIGAFEVPSSAAPTVTSVAVSGSPSSPTVTIDGTNFGQFPPPGSPEWDCGGTFTGDVYANVGLNLGDQTGGWTAGQGGDCLGLTVSSWSQTSIQLALGSYYPNVSPMATGDTYTFQLQGYQFTGTVS